MRPFVLLTSTLLSAASDGLEARLRRAVRLPQLGLQSGFGFQGSQDRLMEDFPEDPEAEHARLVQSLRGRPEDALIWSRIVALELRSAGSVIPDKSAVGATTRWRQWLLAALEDGVRQVGLAWRLRQVGDRNEAERLMRQRRRQCLAQAPDYWEA